MMQGKKMIFVGMLILWSLLMVACKSSDEVNSTTEVTETSATTEEETNLGVDERLILWYEFNENDGNVVPDSTENGNDGTLYNGIYEDGAVKLSGANAYVQMPNRILEGLKDITVFIDIYVEPSSIKPFWLYTFGSKLDGGTEGSHYFGLLNDGNNNFRASLTLNRWGGEQSTIMNTPLVQGAWLQYAFTLKDNTASLYQDGVLMKSNQSVTINPEDIESTISNYIGKPAYGADNYLKGKVRDFRIYNVALTEKELQEFSLVNAEEIVNADYEDLTIVETASWNLELPSRGKNGSYITWTSTHPDYETIEGKILQPTVGEENLVLELTAQIKKGDFIKTKKISTTVLARLTEYKNPIIDGLYADPSMIKVGDTYYLYPTTDGYPGWSGYQFSVFSSKDLINWENEGIILDLKTDQVPWAVGSAWAPAIAEKDGKFYFYYCGKLPNGVSAIGVAVADHPTGPFEDIGEPLITIEETRAQGVRMGQTIDPSIYFEEDGTPYLLFGNGDAAIVELNPDMVSIKLETMQNLNGMKDFREAPDVFKRNGIYHFTWSSDDTGSENYHVNYGTSTSLFAPIQFQYTILEKKPVHDILGTGHHAIVKEPGEDKYYIVYHRFGTPLDQYPDGKGYNREVCLDVITFDENGLINVVDPQR